MTVTINGSTGIDKVQDGSIVQADLASNVVGNGPAFYAYRSTSQTVSASTYTKIALDAELFDTNNNFASNRFTPTVAGYYSITATVYGDGNTGVIPSIYKNGSAYSYGSYIATASTGPLAVVTSVVYLNGSTDYVELYALLTAGATVGAGQQLTYMSGFLARAA